MLPGFFWAKKFWKNHKILLKFDFFRKKLNFGIAPGRPRSTPIKLVISLVGLIKLKTVQSLFSPVAMGLGAQTIMNWEIMSVGIQWSNVREYTSPSAGNKLLLLTISLVPLKRCGRERHLVLEVRGLFRNQFRSNNRIFIRWYDLVLPPRPILRSYSTSRMGNFVSLVLSLSKIFLEISLSPPWPPWNWWNL